MANVLAWLYIIGLLYVLPALIAYILNRHAINKKNAESAKDRERKSKLPHELLEIAALWFLALLFMVWGHSENESGDINLQLVIAWVIGVTAFIRTFHFWSILRPELEKIKKSEAKKK